MFGLGKKNDDATKTPIPAREPPKEPPPHRCEHRHHEKRRAACTAHEEEARQAFEREDQRLRALIQDARDTMDREIADGRARAAAKRAAINATLAAEIHAELSRLVVAYEDDPKGVAVAMIDEWSKWNDQARIELGDSVGTAHLLMAFRRECGRMHFFRSGSPHAPNDWQYATREEAMKVLAHALESKDRVLVVAAIQGMRVAVRTQPPTLLECAMEDRSAAILSNVTHYDQSVAIDASIESTRIITPGQLQASGLAAGTDDAA